MKKIIVAFLFCLSYFLAYTQNTITVGNTTLTENVVATGIQIPWEILFDNEGYLWVTERRGRVLRINPETGNTQTILNIESAVAGGNGEPGLLGMVLHPNFETTPKVYMVYTYFGSPSIRERLVSYDWDGTALSNEVILLDNLPGANIHNGSRLLVTKDGKLLMTTGDVGNTNYSQNLSSNMGKVLRLNLDGTIPSDNPNPSSYIYSYGHRNAQGICYGYNDIIYSSEHGQNHSDEINIIEADRNYGWPQVEGPCNTSFETNYCNSNNIKEPIFAWTNYCIAPNGLVYYDHPAIPEFQHSLLVAILGGISAQEPRISQLKLSTDGLEVLEEVQYFTTYGRIRDVAIHPVTGAIFFATNGSSYPGAGPNQIIEYRNNDFITSTENLPDTDLHWLKVAPNPVGELAQLTFSEKFVGGTYEVIAFSGQRIYEGSIGDTALELKTTNLPSGMYYIKATHKEGFITKTFVVE